MAARKRLAAVPADDPGPQLPVRTVEVRLTGDLAGFHLTMQRMTASQVIALQRGTLGETELLELAADRAVSHNFPVKNLLDLDYGMILQVFAAWTQAMKDDVLPLVTESS